MKSIYFEVSVPSDDYCILAYTMWEAECLFLPFYSKTDSPFSMIGVDTVFTVHLNGSEIAEMGMILPGFAEEALHL